MFSLRSNYDKHFLYDVFSVKSLLQFFLCNMAGGCGMNNFIYLVVPSSLLFILVLVAKKNEVNKSHSMKSKKLKIKWFTGLLSKFCYWPLHFFRYQIKIEFAHYLKFWSWFLFMHL